MNADIRCIIGLGNPGQEYALQRHNIGFRIIDAVCSNNNGSWQIKNSMAIAEVAIRDKNILLIKPLTGMNLSGSVIASLRKKGITPEQTIVVHDELEKKFGDITLKKGGSARGHNGLRSLISVWGENFYRLRCGIGRPIAKDEVPQYVLSRFSESYQDVEDMIQKATSKLDEIIPCPAAKN